MGLVLVSVALLLERGGQCSAAVLCYKGGGSAVGLVLVSVVLLFENRGRCRWSSREPKGAQKQGLQCPRDEDTHLCSQWKQGLQCPRAEDTHLCS